MAKPIAPAQGIAFAFPDVCNTPTAAPNPSPLPYPNTADLSQAINISNVPGKEVKVGGVHILLENSEVPVTTGDEAGSAGGVKSMLTKGPCRMTSCSQSVKCNGEGIVRFMDTTEQNVNKGTQAANASGMVLSANPTVMVGD